MPNYTDKYKLTKPLQSELYNVDVNNENMDKVDKALDDLDNGKVKKSGDSMSGHLIVGTNKKRQALVDAEDDCTKINTQDASWYEYNALYLYDEYTLCKRPLRMPYAQYFIDGNHGLNMNNADIIGMNGMYFEDDCNSAGEGINFYRSETTWDSLYSSGGTLYYVPNRALNEVGTRYNVYHSGAREKMFESVYIESNVNILEQPNGIYHREGEISKANGWPYSSSDAKLEVLIWGNRNATYGYWNVEVVNMYSGERYMNTHCWDHWLGWKKITTTDVT